MQLDEWLLETLLWGVTDQQRSRIEDNYHPLTTVFLVTTPPIIALLDTHILRSDIRT